ncbi:MAG TPA: hypothetical protein VEP90_21900, partial [Methylomirabilota bacterium]|nr:hypothetical protein [Methylomirabilota bacterium]
MGSVQYDALSQIVIDKGPRVVGLDDYDALGLTYVLRHPVLNFSCLIMKLSKHSVVSSFIMMML